MSLLWSYGTCLGNRARRHRLTGEVQFVLWRAGQQGHATDYWHAMHRDHWPGFTSETLDAANPHRASDSAPLRPS